MKRFATAALTLFVLAACNAPGPAAPETTEPVAQHWICGREYVNFAWGYQRRGVVLDGDGHVWSYQIKGTPQSLPNPWQPKDLNKLTAADLSVRYNGAVDTGQRTTGGTTGRRPGGSTDAAGTTMRWDRASHWRMCARIVRCRRLNSP